MSAILLILSAPSGTGKTTLARLLCAAHPGAIFSISYTTRAPRGREVDGVDYHFVSEERFRQLAAEGAFVEWAEVYGHHYGTPRAVIDETRARSGLAVFDIDTEGGNAIKAKHPDAVRALILPPTLAELERRLRARSTDGDATIVRRLERARAEISAAIASSYDYWVINEEIDRAFADLEAIVRAERCRAGRRALAADLGPQAPRP